MDLIGFLFEVTGRCNSNCKFCYNVWKENSGYPRGELGVEEIKQLFDKILRGVPTKSIYIGGGEPLLRDDLEKIVSYFKSKKLSVAIATNGTLLTRQRAKSLIESGVDKFEITLLSANRNLHNNLCGNNDGYDKACEAVVNVREFKKPVIAGFVATRDNIEDVSDVMDLSFALGANALAFYRFVPTGRGLVNNDNLMPDLDQVNDALDVLDKKSEQYNLKIFMGIPIEPCEIKNKLKNIKLSYCQGGISKFTIDYLGNLRVCEQSPEILGNLFERSFVSLMLNKKVRNFKKFCPDECNSCKDKKVCRGGCRFLCRCK